ncbi:nephrocystin-3-like [Hibiscus syriacus]|uniref:Autophagy-related protein 9 n=1 Tax=Hibiscus syriacus TaxID=106335 RepID=A0A6A2XKI7_HIBSY|nr:nephrocystin-3-like [Hibiscus syriacus]
MVVGLVMLLLSPFLVIFMLVYLFLRHAEQFYNHPSMASSRRWSNLSKWMFREFNEVDHLFKHRINSSVVHASEYLKRFPSPIISIIAKFISFVSGGFAAILIIIAFLEESLLEGQIFGRNLFWYAAVFGTITAISRAAVTDELLVLDHEGAMSMVVQHTHYMPKRWRGRENTETVRREFETLFQYTGMMLLEEMASIFLTPFLLIFVVPKRVDDVLQFIADFTVDIEGVGHACRQGAFDFSNHGNENYGSPHNAPRAQRSSQGKMEKSFLSFQSSYPSWEPDARGKQFLSNIRTFREKKLQTQGTRHAYYPGRLWQASPPRAYGDRNGLLSREMQHDIPDTGRNLGSLWVTDAEQKNHPYLLDWYYTTSRTRCATGYRGDTAVTRPFEPGDQRYGDYWVPTNMTHNEARDEDYWSHHYNDQSRLQSHLEASTSASFFHESVLQHHDTNELPHDARSHWWDRSSSHSIQPETSFLEPPDFNRYSSDRQYDNLSERSVEEEDQFLDLRPSRRLSCSTYMDDLEAGRGDVSLHFDDIFSRPPETPTVNLRAPRLDLSK